MQSTCYSWNRQNRILPQNLPLLSFGSCCIFLQVSVQFSSDFCSSWRPPLIILCKRVQFTTPQPSYTSPLYLVYFSSINYRYIPLNLYCIIALYHNKYKFCFVFPQYTSSFWNSALRSKCSINIFTPMRTLISGHIILRMRLQEQKSGD